MDDLAPDWGAEGPASLARQHRMVTIGGRMTGSASPGERVEVKRVCECHLDRLHARSKLSDREWLAGLRFRRYWLRATFQTRVVGRYSELVGGSDSQDAAIARADAKAALGASYSVLSMPERLAVQAVAGCDLTAHRRLLVLRAGLERLADWWGIEALVEECAA